MAKTRALTTISPFDVVQGKDIRTEDIAEIIEMQQWAQEFNADYIVSDMGRYKYVLNSTVTQVLEFPIWINTDIQTIVIEIRTYAPDFGVGESCRVRVQVGSSAIQNFTCNNANAGALQQGSVTAASSGTGLQFCYVTSDTHAGAHVYQRLDLFALYGHRRTTIGDPPDA